MSERADATSAATCHDLERLRRSPRACVLFTSHDGLGGVRRHIDDLADVLADDLEILLLRPYGRSSVSLSWLRRGEALQLWFHRDDEWDRLVATLRYARVARVHVHHVHGLPQAVLELPRRLDVPCDVTLHDYFPVCPQYLMTDATGRYCGEVGEAGCMRCLEGSPPQWPLSIREWRDAFRALLSSAARVIVPSHDAARRVRRYFPEVTPLVWPHAERSRECSIVEPCKVLVPGALSPAKGLHLLEACARDAARRDVPLHFRVLGYVAPPPLPLWPELPLSVAGEFPEGALPALIALERGDAFFFPVQCPETHSYTLSAALATDLPIVATDLGALSERLQGRRDARVVRWDEEPAVINDALVEVLAADTRRVRLASSATSPAEYRGRYLEPIQPSRDGSSAATAPIAARQLSAPEESQPRPNLPALFEDAFFCGNRRSAAVLEGCLRDVDAALSNVDDDRAQLHAMTAALADARRTIDGLERERDAARAAGAAAETYRRLAEGRNREFEASTSWRLTAPLRALARLLRQGGKAS